MASNSRNIRDDHHNNNNLAFTSKTPHFFKVLLTDAIQHGKLKIPEKFVSKYGSAIASPVFLKVPCGAIWEIELTKSGSELWLQKGWRKFVEHYSLDIEDFVVFRYEGNSLFNIILFDKGASEIEYIPPRQDHGNLNEPSQGTEVKQEKEDDEISVEILDDMPTRSSKRVRGNLACQTPSKKPRINSNAKRTNGNSKFTSRGTKVGSHSFNVSNRNGCSPRRTQGLSGSRSASARKSNARINVSPGQGHGHGSMQRTMRGREKDRACQIASSFKSRNPFFTVVMQPSFLSDRYRMGLPTIFARKYFMDRQCKVHCVVDGKTWSMDFIATGLKFVPRFSNGWKEFSIDNKLNVRDVCVFELINNVEITFNVFIFHNEVAESPGLPNSSGSWNSDDGNGANVVKYMENLDTNPAIKSEGVISSIDEQVAAQESQLPGDNLNQVMHHKSGGSQYTQGASSLDGVLEASSNLPPKDPYFEAVMRPCYLTHGGLKVPSAFAKRYCSGGTKLITLQVEERRWSVKLKSYGWRWCLTSGWTRFAKENSLQKDDVCVFHLINTTDMVLRVSILKQAAAAA